MRLGPRTQDILPQDALIIELNALHVRLLGLLQDADTAALLKFNVSVVNSDNLRVQLIHQQLQLPPSSSRIVRRASISGPRPPPSFNSAPFGSDVGSACSTTLASGETCPLCLDPLPGAPFVMRNCVHQFCPGCALRALSASDTCPCCRAPQNSALNSDGAVDYGEQKFEVSSVLDCCPDEEGTLLYLVDWVNYPGKVQWLSSDHLHCNTLIAEYHREYGYPAYEDEECGADEAYVPLSTRLKRRLVKAKGINAVEEEGSVEEEASAV